MSSKRARHATYRKILENKEPSYHTTLTKSDIVVNAKGVAVPKAKRTRSVLQRLEQNREEWMEYVEDARQKYDAMPASKRPAQWYKKVLQEAAVAYRRR